MERLITVRDVRMRYGCSAPTARKYLRQMYHYENPLAAPEWAFAEWERSRECMPSVVSYKRQLAITQRTKTGGRVIVPRTREMEG